MNTEKKTLTAQELALYLGCDAIVFNAKLPVKLKAVSSDGKVLVSHEHNEYWMSIDIPNNIKPILRPFSDITQQEKDEIAAWMKEVKDSEAEMMMATAKAFKILFEKHFDLFNWIPQGLALDVTKFKHPSQI